MNRVRRILAYILADWGKEGLFLRLLSLLLLGSSVAIYGPLKLASAMTKYYNPYFVLLIEGGVVVFVLLVIAGVFLLGITLLTKIELPVNDKIRKITIYFFLPLTIFLGKILGIPKEQIQESFLEANNKLIQVKTYNITPQRILLLLPHCLQNSHCSIRLIPEGNNCQRCGGCDIRDLWEIVDRYKIKLALATGGEIARKFIKDLKPEVVVAVACTKEMILGIQDTYPLLVLSIVNQRPNGPCIDTMVDLGRVEDAIKFFLGDDKGARQSVVHSHDAISRLN